MSARNESGESVRQQWMLGGVHLTVVITGRRLAERVAGALDRLGADQGAASPISSHAAPRTSQPRSPHTSQPDPLRIDVRAPAEAPAIPPRMQEVGTLGDVRLYRSDRGFYLAAPNVRALLDGPRRRAQIVLPPGASPDAVFGGVSRIVLAMLRYVDRYTLHAACVVAPGGEGVLIAAPTSSGKSTLALALVRSGWRYAGDDLVLLCDMGDTEDTGDSGGTGETGDAGDTGGMRGGVAARGLLRDFSLDPSAAGRFPEIERHARSREGGKWSIDVDALAEGRRVDQCRPEIIVFPRIVDEPVSSFRDVEAAAAVSRLARQINVVTLMETDVASAQLQLCGRLVSQCRAFELRGGRDIAEAPSVVAELFGELVAV